MSTPIQESRVANVRPALPRLRPRVDIVERDNAFEIHVGLPGVSEENLTVLVEPDLLTIEGIMDDPAPAGKKPLYREHRAGSYFRQFALSDIVDHEQIVAQLTNGLLTVTLPKPEKAQPRRIAVTAA